ncbi:uncharacterized protein LOC144577119 [Callithrix jacchus]
MPAVSPPNAVSVPGKSSRRGHRLWAGAGAGVGCVGPGDAEAAVRRNDTGLPGAAGAQSPQASEAGERGTSQAPSGRERRLARPGSHLGPGREGHRGRCPASRAGPAGPGREGPTLPLGRAPPRAGSRARAGRLLSAGSLRAGARGCRGASDRTGLAGVNKGRPGREAGTGARGRGGGAGGGRGCARARGGRSRAAAAAETMRRVWYGSRGRLRRGRGDGAGRGRGRGGVDLGRALPLCAEPRLAPSGRRVRDPGLSLGRRAPRHEEAALAAPAQVPLGGAGPRLPPWTIHSLWGLGDGQKTNDRQSPRAQFVPSPVLTLPLIVHDEPTSSHSPSHWEPRIGGKSWPECSGHASMSGLGLAAEAD